MSQYWSMKTFLEWANLFAKNDFIGIDQEGIDHDYRNLKNTNIKALLDSEELDDMYTEYKDRMFREFTLWMQVGDIVLIGTGQMTVFNLSAVVQVTSDYYFEKATTPRHLRKTKTLAALAEPQSMQRFSRTSRLELIHESDFHEAILSLLK